MTQHSPAVAAAEAVELIGGHNSVDVICQNWQITSTELRSKF